MSEINSQALREAAEQAMHDDWGFDADLFHELVTPSIVLELLDERERNQQYIKRRDQENEDIALTVGKLRVELEAAKSKLNEQREYYEGVIADGSKRIAKMEAIKSAAEKLVRCKGRYHSEQNYRALAALFGITVPDLPPLEVEPALYMNRFTRKTFSLEEQPGADKEPEIYMPLYAAPPAPVVPEKLPREYRNGWPLAYSDYAEGWNDCREAMLQSGNFRENTNSSTNNFRKIPETSTNYPAIPSEVLSAILKVARIRADFDDFDGDRRGIGDCLDEAEQELIVTINKYASQLAAEPIAPNDVREQTAIPQVPVTPDGWISCSERMPDDRQEVNQ
ncbi:hypothetical protein DW524_05020 [Escherichia coli]|nr:hypothetical protein [Escherichia coli]EFN5620069.1 hypothetical protein [Escherichia coli]EFO1159316.1 hypothetical protein [Escherichia coli]EGH5866580.1 hypothetical protein [Escherichia coli]EGI4762092.1 hypothetical protein [Escherichia coli]